MSGSNHIVADWPVPAKVLAWEGFRQECEVWLDELLAVKVSLQDELSELRTWCKNVQSRVDGIKNVLEKLRDFADSTISLEKQAEMPF